MTGLAIFLLLWGATTALVALLKPPRVWNIAKIQAIVSSIGETPAVGMMLFWAVVAIVVGVVLLV